MKKAVSPSSRRGRSYSRGPCARVGVPPAGKRLTRSARSIDRRDLAAANRQGGRRWGARGLAGVRAGLGWAALAASLVGRPAGRLDPVVGVITGFAFAFAGAILVVPERRKRLRAWIGALMITCIALLFD